MGARTTQRRLWGAAGSVVTHLVLLAIALWSLRTAGPPPERQAVEVELVRISPLALKPPRAASRARRAPKAAALASSAAPGPAAAPPPRPASAPAPAAGPAEAAAVRAMLRAALGCGEPGLLRLTAAERARCARRLAELAQPDLAWSAPIPAEKRALYDAVVAARQGARRPDLIGCVLPFDSAGFKPVSGPGYGLKLGPLPCYTGYGRALKTQDIRNGQLSPDPLP